MDVLLRASADVKVEVDKDGETALTLVREELVLMRLLTDVSKKELNYLITGRSIDQKICFMKEEDIIRAERYFQESNTRQEPPSVISIIEKACGESFTEKQKEEIGEMFNKMIPKYKAIRKKLLVAGGYDMQKVKKQNTQVCTLYLSSGFSSDLIFKNLLEHFSTSDGHTPNQSLS